MVKQTSVRDPYKYSTVKARRIALSQCSEQEEIVPQGRPCTGSPHAVCWPADSSLSGSAKAQQRR